MYWSRLTILFPFALHALHVAAVAVNTSLVADSDIPAGFELCIQAENCELYKLEDGTWSFRFVEGKEPGTEWYNTYANTTGDIGPEREAQQLTDVRVDKRQPCSSTNGQTCTHIWVRPHMENYGNILPRTAIDSLWSKCYDFGCNVGDYGIGVRNGHNGDLFSFDQTLKISPGGVYDPAFRHALIFAMTEIAGQFQESFKVSGGVSRHGTTWHLTLWRAPHRMHVARFHNGYLQGEIHAFVYLEGSDTWGCDRIMGILGSTIGALHPVVGATLGALSAACG
ncbi:uncharacterized protein B0I36DRAFT_343654 [Microdochium trichocladiopsis]|uniref:Uncharacterized protein n=1 Tax=Microdochium trichocladiopsis TaxID=1682393 RepID=A0A9P8YFZ7_9PEZI|nr:uncharacterized protein B0I36DRAFT_343654 [Microdochium trichocladiopsis]KAH7039816.1 hypothetical protein B0I36DRAFT_343654 [Microdochium trichocladiopsis]